MLLRRMDRIVGKLNPKARTRIVGKTVVVDFPRSPGELHGSSFATECNKTCDVEGDIVASSGMGELFDAGLKKFNCEVVDIHPHTSPFPADHVHFKCAKISPSALPRIAEFISYF